ncbi:MAG: hypothetical protein LBP59_12820 [Planctomycetaceae bacterium]|jgi:hypothetical protein|nr:hypothetical protein [Planctomycetaceae bacterium]
MRNKKNVISAVNTLTFFLSLVCLCCFIFSAVGCRFVKVRGLVPAEGIVLYEDVPLAWAIISFAPENIDNNTRIATAQTDGKGRFTLTTLGDNGILPGNYKISVTKYLQNEGKDTVTEWKNKRRYPDFKEQRPDENVFNVVLAIPEKFTTTKNSGLTFTIEAKGNRNITIELK